MKKPIALLLGLLLCLAAVTAAGEGDPLISRSYLEGGFLQSLEEKINVRLDASDQLIRGEAGRTDALPKPAAREHMLKKGDVLSGVTGLSVTVLAGEVRLDVSGGAVVDVTEGREVPAGQTLAANHRYLVAENAAADFTAASPAAVLSSEGDSVWTPSSEMDPFAAARALRTLGLFRGTGSGFGEGFDLHLAPTRGEGLVMFLRLLGEEDQALAWTGDHPFTDVPAWLDRYAAWAYAQGYANGIAPDRFGAGQTLSAVEYQEFLLRALGYSQAGVDDYTTSLERALNCGALSGQDYAMLRDEAFLRAQVAWISYQTLDVPARGGGETLAQRLAAAGIVTAEQLAAAEELANPVPLP